MPGSAWADGAFFALDETPVGVPYQRALIFHDGTNECLVLQSEYQLSKHSVTTNIAWVVPVPAVPDLAAMFPESATRFFWMLAFNTLAHTTRISDCLLIMLYAVIGVTPLLGILLYWISDFTRWPAWVAADRERIMHVSMMIFYCFFLLSLAFGLLMPALGSAGAGVVDEVKHEQVGIYDVRVIKGTDAAAVMAWLQRGGFQCPAAASNVCARYVAKGWYFVAAKVNPQLARARADIMLEGLVAPLVLKFPVARPIYPLALTATAERPTQLLLYVVSQGKVSCDKRLRMTFAGQRHYNYLENLGDHTDPRGFLSPAMLQLPFVTKFKGVLSPEQMKEDLQFTAAPDHEPVREHVIVW
jgi:hypothetical protein